MHEFGIAEELVKAAVAELARFTPATLRRVRVVAGGLRQIVPENLAFAYDVLVRDTPAAGSELEIVILPLEGTCACGWHGALTMPVFQCGACGSFTVSTPGGMALYLDALEIEQDDDTGN